MKKTAYIQKLLDGMTIEAKFLYARWCELTNVPNFLI